MRHALLVALTLSSLSSPSLSQTAALSSYTADYQAQANGLSATARRSLERDADGAFRLSNFLEATLAGQSLASLQQSSEFSLQAGRLVPQSYSYQLSGVSRASHAIAYNWDAAVAISSEDGDNWRLPLHDGVVDQLSFQAALSLALMEDSETRDSFAFDIIDGDEIDRHEYRLVGEELLATPLGELNTLKLEKVRAADDERVTEIWLAIDWEFLLARLEQVNGSGLHIVLELREAELDGEAVTAMD